MRKNQYAASHWVEMENKLHFPPAPGTKEQMNGSCQGPRAPSLHGARLGKVNPRGKAGPSPRLACPSARALVRVSTRTQMPAPLAHTGPHPRRLQTHGARGGQPQGCAAVRLADKGTDGKSAALRGPCQCLHPVRSPRGLPALQDA